MKLSTLYVPTFSFFSLHFAHATSVLLPDGMRGVPREEGLFCPACGNMEQIVDVS
jgi:hypothetical protein